MLAAAYSYLYTGALFVLGALVLLGLIRAIRGPRVSDRVVAINMISTLIIAMICVLAVLKGEGYLVDVALIYSLLGFLAVVVLCKVYIGIAMQRKAAADEQPADDKLPGQPAEADHTADGAVGTDPCAAGEEPAGEADTAETGACADADRAADEGPADDEDAPVTETELPDADEAAFPFAVKPELRPEPMKAHEPDGWTFRVEPQPEAEPVPKAAPEAAFAVPEHEESPAEANRPRGEAFAFRHEDDANGPFDAAPADAAIPWQITHDFYPGVKAKEEAAETAEAEVPETGTPDEAAGPQTDTSPVYAEAEPFREAGSADEDMPEAENAEDTVRADASADAESAAEAQASPEPDLSDLSESPVISEETPADSWAQASAKLDALLERLDREAKERDPHA